MSAFKNLSTPGFKKLDSKIIWGFLIFLLSLGFMSWKSWQKWPDLIIDSGQQLYVPWQLSQGQVLYTDIQWFWGPLSAYLHAFVFTIFGPGILVLAVFNILLIILLGGILFGLIRKISDDLTGMVSALVFIFVFAFGQYTENGSFNFVHSYSYEMNHGVFLSFMALYLFTKYLESHKDALLCSLGFIMGLVFLTKPEVFLAAFVSLSISLALHVYLQKTPVRIILLKVFKYLGSFTIPLAMFTIYFSFHMPLREALYYIFSPWFHILNPVNRDIPYYQIISGMNALGDNLLIMFLSALVFFILLAAMIALIKIKQLGTPRSNPITWISVIFIIGGALYFYNEIPWFSFTRPLPILTFIFGCFLLYRLLKRRDRADPNQTLALFAFTFFGFLMMLKIFFLVRVIHYGFALTFPATLGAVIFLIHYFPKLIGTSAFFKPAQVCLLSIIFLFTFWSASFSITAYNLKQFPVGEGRDKILDYSPQSSLHQGIHSRGMMVKYALEVIDQEMDKDEEFVTLPDTVMLNYLSRRKNPIGTLFFNSGIAPIAGEERLLSSLKAKRPNYIIFVHQDFSHYGYRFFGKDYATATYDWIQEHYTPFRLIGHEPFTDKGFGIQILKKVVAGKQAVPDQP